MYTFDRQGMARSNGFWKTGKYNWKNMHCMQVKFRLPAPTPAGPCICLLTFSHVTMTGECVHTKSKEKVAPDLVL